MKLINVLIYVVMDLKQKKNNVMITILISKMDALIVFTPVV